MKVTAEDGYLVIRLKLQKQPHPSKSGKTMIVASSRGPRRTILKYREKPYESTPMLFTTKPNQRNLSDPQGACPLRYPGIT